MTKSRHCSRLPESDYLLMPKIILNILRSHKRLMDWLNKNIRYMSIQYSNDLYIFCFVAPEIFHTNAKKSPGYSHAVDWWSLAVTCYELCNGSV